MMSRRHLLATLSLCALTLSPQLATAQSEDVIPRFDKVEVQQLRPEQITGALPEEDPATLLKPNLTLSDPLTEAQLEALHKKIAANTMEVIALHMPPQPYEQIPMIYRGHAVWLSAQPDGKNPVLVTTLAWLQDAREIYMVPTPEAPSKLTRKGPKELSIEQLSTGRDAWRAFEKHKKDYIRLELAAHDELRGLALLSPNAQGKPARGLELFDPEREQLDTLYGYSYLYPDRLTPSRLLPDRPSQEEISFFFLSDYVATLGAPLCTSDGHVLMLNALPHPRNAALTLAIPPRALRQFVERHQPGAQSAEQQRESKTKSL